MAGGTLCFDNLKWMEKRAHESARAARDHETCCKIVYPKIYLVDKGLMLGTTEKLRWQPHIGREPGWGYRPSSQTTKTAIQQPKHTGTKWRMPKLVAMMILSPSLSLSLSLSLAIPEVQLRLRGSNDDALTYFHTYCIRRQLL